MQMQIVTMQWLTTNHFAFHSENISPNVLEKVIRRHVHKVELSHLAEINDSEMIYPRTSKIFTKNVITDKFILILEGRAIVNIGEVSLMMDKINYFFRKK